MKYDVKNIKLYLKKNDVNKVELMGIMGILIISKDLIRKNIDVGNFVEDVMGVNFPEYVIKSRTLISARVNRILVDVEDDAEIRKIRKKVLEYLDDTENEKLPDELEKTTKKVKKENENDKLKKWLRGL